MKHTRLNSWISHTTEEDASSGKNDEIEKVMFRIMQIVMNWEPEAENDEV